MLWRLWDEWHILDATPRVSPFAAVAERNPRCRSSRRNHYRIEHSSLDRLRPIQTLELRSIEEQKTSRVTELQTTRRSNSSPQVQVEVQVTQPLQQQQQQQQSYQHRRIRDQAANPSSEEQEDPCPKPPPRVSFPYLQPRNSLCRVSFVGCPLLFFFCFSSYNRSLGIPRLEGGCLCWWSWRRR